MGLTAFSSQDTWNDVEEQPVKRKLGGAAGTKMFFYFVEFQDKTFHLDWSNELEILHVQCVTDVGRASC